MKWRPPAIAFLFLELVAVVLVPNAVTSHLLPKRYSDSLSPDQRITSVSNAVSDVQQDGRHPDHPDLETRGDLPQKKTLSSLKHQDRSSSVRPAPISLDLNSRFTASKLKAATSTYESKQSTLDLATNGTSRPRRLLRFRPLSLRDRLQRSSLLDWEQALAALVSNQSSLPGGAMASGSYPTKVAKLVRRAPKRAAASRIPSCSGPCCSNSPPTVPRGAPSMPSQWISNVPPHGAQVQVRSINWNTWWAPRDGKRWNSAVVATKSQPPASVFLAVLRISATKLRLRTPSGTFIRAGPVYAYQNTGSPSLDTTPHASDPATVFTILPSATVYAAVVIRCYDGRVLSGSSPDGSFVLRWGTSAGSWEQWQFREIMTIPKIRGVNLGSWLVYENWMDPAAFPRAPLLIDSRMFTLQSVATRKYVSTRQNKQISCSTSFSEPFSLRTTRLSNTYQFRSTWYYCLWRLSGRSAIVADSVVEGGKGLENFQLFFPPASIAASFSTKRVLIRSSNGRFLRATSSGALIADVLSTTVHMNSAALWKSAAAFYFVPSSALSGEWQLARTRGRTAPAAFRNRWASWMKESDWAYLASQKINAVRIPIGYWLTEGAKPDSPYVSGGAAFLDWAFAMGNKYSIRIWISMHAVPGSQNGQQASGARESLTLWHLYSQNVKKTVAAVGWISQRYASNHAWLGIGLVNEPSSVVPLSFLQSYWTAGYEAVRAHSKCAFVSMEGRLNPWEARWTNSDPYYTNLIVEMHVYDVFRWDIFSGKNAQYEIQYMRVNWTQQFRDIGTSGRMLLIGEFSNAMAWPNYSDGWKTQKAFALAQMQAMGAAQAGWFFWSYKTASKDIGWQWNFPGSAKQGWLPKKRDGNWY